MRVFLSAEWRDLVMVNYEVDPKLLHEHVPPGTVLDSFEGSTYVSLVGFQFCRTKLLGAVPIPFHSNFDEVNLRFYVRRREGGEERRGVVFIAEIVPRWAIAKVARLAYGENYIRLPMKHRIEMNGATKTAEYEWRQDGAQCKVYARASSSPAPVKEGSLEQFITEHYWVIRSSEMARSSTESRMCRGMSGLPRRRDSRVTRAACTVQSLERFSSAGRTLPSLRTARRSKYSQEGRFNDGA